MYSQRRQYAFLCVCCLLHLEEERKRCDALIKWLFKASHFFFALSFVNITIEKLNDSIEKHERIAFQPDL